MTPARVLLVEDDASIRRLVEMALEALPIDLRMAPTLAEARRLLAEAPVELLICDLMLPDGSGTDLLRELAAAEPPARAVRRVAFSAGVSAAVRAELLAAGVHEVLPKPASVFALVECVEQALASLGATAPEAADTAPAAAEAAAPPGTESVGPDGADGGPDPAEAAIDRFFGGDRALFLAYRSQCAGQFAHDRATGRQALAAADWQALRRLAHSLKTVLQTLGHPAASAQAAALEQTAAQAADVPDAAAQARALWPRVDAALARLAAGP